MNEQIRSLFPALSKYTYLNSAAVSPLPTTAIEAVRKQLDDVSLNGSNNYLEWVATKNRARALAAEMLGVRTDQVAFMRNTSDGFAAVANGIEWKTGDNIVSYEQEGVDFPDNANNPHYAATLTILNPEPGTAALFGVGLLGLAAVGRRRRALAERQPGA